MTHHFWLILDTEFLLQDTSDKTIFRISESRVKTFYGTLILGYSAASGEDGSQLTCYVFDSRFPSFNFLVVF